MYGWINTASPSLVPRPSAGGGGGEGRRYTLFAHAPNFPDIPVIPWHSRILSVFELPECRENLAILYVSVKSEGLGTRLGLAVLIQPRNKFALPTGSLYQLV